MIIDVSGPAGNVFCILGHAQEFQRELERAGVKGGNPAIAKILKEYTALRYDEILDRLEATGLFEFEGRND